MVRTVLIICILLFVVTPINVFASEDISVPDEYEELLNSIPDDVADMLPDELFADDIDNIAQGANKITSWNYIFDIMFDALGFNIKTLAKTLAIIIGLLALCALLNMLKGSMKSDSCNHIINLISGVVVASTLLGISKEPLQRAMLLLEEIKVFTNTMSPVICSMYAQCMLWEGTSQAHLYIIMG